MPNTYTQLYIHCVFAVKFRQSVIQSEWEEQLNKYITGIVQNNGHKLLAINSASDHMHIFFGLNPKQSLSEMMRLVKGDSAEFVNKQKFTATRFQWQEGYGAFSNSRSQITDVIQYISNQKVHHLKKSFKDEYQKMLEVYGIEYDEQYLFSGLV
jgi:REP element-mobilizing transposase RayT